MSKSKAALAREAAHRAEKVAQLREVLKPGDTVYTVLRHAAPSGMFRVIDLVIPYMRRDTVTVSATVPGLKIGAQAYSTSREGARAFSTGTVTALDAESVEITYESAATAPASVARYPRESVSFYKKLPPRPALRSIGYLACEAMGDSWDSDRQGIKAGGYGMDMGFNLVYNLGATIWPKGTKKPHGRRNGEPDSAGGYALKHSWL